VAILRESHLRETALDTRMNARYLWATRRLLLRFFGSIQCSIRCAKIRASKNSCVRSRASNEIPRPQKEFTRRGGRFQKLFVSSAY